MADRTIDDILNRMNLPRQVAHNLVFKCRVYRLKDGLQKDEAEKELKAQGYSTFWGLHNYFNNLFLQDEIRISPRIAHAVLAKTESRRHRILLASEDAAFLCLNRFYGLVVPPTSNDPDVFFI